MERFEDLLKEMNGLFSTDSNISALTLCINLCVAAVLALYVRFLFRRFSSTASDTDSVSRSFPLLAVVIAGVIAVIKSSLSLSLGLVGALSIVRFRAAIKDPEELVYLFLCIAIGLSMGAEQPLLAVAVVSISTVVTIGMHLTIGKHRQHRLLLTITGHSERHFTDKESGVLPTIREVVGQYTLQRLDLEDGRGQIRIVLDESDPQKTVQIISALHQRLPECEVSYVNLNSTL